MGIGCFSSPTPKTRSFCNGGQGSQPPCTFWWCMPWSLSCLTGCPKVTELSSVLSYLSRSLADYWGTTVDFTTSFLHYSRFSVFHSMIFPSRPVHSLMLSSYCSLCLPLRLPPRSVPCRIVFASQHDLVTCPYHFSLRLFTELRRSSYGLMACPSIFTSVFISVFVFVREKLVRG